MSRAWSLIAVLVSAACFGTLAVLTPMAYEAGAQPLQLLAWRFALASVLLAVFSVIRDRGAMKVPLSDIGRFSVLALTGYGAASVCFFFALRFADPSIVAVLLYAYPAFVMISGWLFMSQRATWRQVAAVALTFIGCALVVGLGSGRMYAAWQGVVLGLVAALGYTVFNIFSHRWLPGRSRLTMMSYTFGIAVLLPLVGSSVLYGPASLVPTGWTLTTWMLLAAIILVPTFAAIVLYLEGIRGLGPAQAAIVSTFEPIVTIALSAWLLGERLEGLQFVGAGFVIAGVVTAEIGARHVDEPAPS